MGRKGKETGADAKKVIVDLMQSGLSRRKISEMLKIPKSTVIDICKRFSDTGSLENKPRSGKRMCSLSDNTARFNEKRPEPVSRRTIQHHLHKNNYRRSETCYKGNK